MPRFTLIVAFAALAVAACEKRDPLFCGPNDMTERCMSIDAAPPPPPPPCTDNTGCKTAAAPVCETAGGEGVCVMCNATDHALCKDTTPICTDHVCKACGSASDCPLSGICLASGACAEEGDVAYVDPDGTDTSSCTKALPCTKIASALATMTTGGMPRPYLKLIGTISEGVTITRNVTVLGDPGASLTRSNGGAILAVSGSAVVEIDDLIITGAKGNNDPGLLTSETSAVTLKRVRISENKGHGIACSGSALTVSGSTFTANEATGITCTRGNVTVTASTFSKNTRGGLSLSGGSFDVTNNFIYDNGDKDGSDLGGVLVNPMGGSTNHFEFNTVVANHVRDFITAPTAGVICDQTGFMAPNNIISGNDIHDDLNRPNSNTAGKCMYPTSAVNTPLADLMFVSLVDPRDYHLKSGSVAIGAAITPTTLTTDFDGDPRTAAVNDQGADQVKRPGI